MRSDDTTNSKYRTKLTYRYKNTRRQADGQANRESTLTYPGEQANLHQETTRLIISLQPERISANYEDIP